MFAVVRRDKSPIVSSSRELVGLRLLHAGELHRLPLQNGPGASSGSHPAYLFHQLQTSESTRSNLLVKARMVRYVDWSPHLSASLDDSEGWRSSALIRTCSRHIAGGLRYQTRLATPRLQLEHRF